MNCVYLLLSRSGTAFSRLIRALTGDEYTHISLGLGDEFKHGPPHEPGYGRRQQDEDGDGGRGYYFLGFFRQLRPVVRRHSPLPCGKYF